MMTDLEKKLNDQVTTLSTQLAAVDAEAKMFKNWWLTEHEKVEKLEAEAAKLTAELASLREAGTIIVRLEPNPTYDGHTFTEIQDMATTAAEKVGALSGSQEG